MLGSRTILATAVMITTDPPSKEAMSVPNASPASSLQRRMMNSSAKENPRPMAAPFKIKLGTCMAVILGR